MQISERPMYVRLAIERARVMIHAPGNLAGFDRATAVAIGMPAWRSPAGHVIDALCDYCALTPDDSIASESLDVLMGRVSS